MYSVLASVMGNTLYTRKEILDYGICYVPDTLKPGDRFTEYGSSPPVDWVVYSFNCAGNKGFCLYKIRSFEITSFFNSLDELTCYAISTGQLHKDSIIYFLNKENH